ncbi:MAG: DUF1287 domain-containing protein [Phycisphaerae bacterium]|nr:DUF1287 domain-containing protein [Phycisphaerae bacterium]
MAAPRLNPVWLLAIAACFPAGCDRAPDAPSNVPTSHPATAPRQSNAPRSPIVAAARGQVGRTVTYDPSYVRLGYPMGDVPIDRGVCTDVVIRALRYAIDTDLQKLLHEDMTTAFSEYPTMWGLRKPDRNIDHRRVPNLRRYFERTGYSVGVSRNKLDYLPGDLVTCDVSRRPHIMIVSDRKTSDGVPLVIHNIGRGAKEENRLFEFRITGHYRIRKPG